MSKASDIIRAMLDERGVEYYKHEDDEPLRKLEKADDFATSWRMGGASVCAVPIEGSELFDLWIDHCTPEQAIAAFMDIDAGQIDVDSEAFGRAVRIMSGKAALGKEMDE